MRSNLDKLRYSFICRNPQCGRQFEKILSSLVDADEVACPICGAAINLYDSKLIGDIRYTWSIALAHFRTGGNQRHPKPLGAILSALWLSLLVGELAT
jgi:hypothetical protein